MTKAEVKTMIAALNIPYAYGHFAEGEAPALPYCIFRYPKSSNFSADSKVYNKADNLDIELYSDKRDVALEAQLEALLDARDVFYQKSEIYIESETLYEILYEMEMVVMGAIVTGFIIWLKGIIKQQNVYEGAVRALAHDCFYRQCRQLLRQENISEDELENLNFLHDTYTALGMNGTGDELYKRCLEKPIK